MRNTKKVAEDTKRAGADKRADKNEEEDNFQQAQDTFSSLPVPVGGTVQTGTSSPREVDKSVAIASPLTHSNPNNSNYNSVVAPQSMAGAPSTTSNYQETTSPHYVDPATAAALDRKEKNKRDVQVIGYGPGFPEKLLQKMNVQIEVGGHQKLDVQLTKSVIVHSISDTSPALGFLEPGDWIRGVDGMNVTSRKNCYSLFKYVVKEEVYLVTLSIKRPLRSCQLLTRRQVQDYLPPAVEYIPGYSHWLGFLYTFPGAKVGLHVKSFQNKVYVSSISHKSMAEKVFCVGDSIISVDDIGVASVTDTNNRVQTALKMKSWVQTVIERPEDEAALVSMNIALHADRKMPVNPKMADDIREFTSLEVRKMLTQEPFRPKGIYRPNPQRINQHIGISKYSRETPVPFDPINLRTLRKCPDDKVAYMAQSKKNRMSRISKGLPVFPPPKSKTGYSSESSTTTTQNTRSQEFTDR